MPRLGFAGGSVGNESTFIARDLGLIPGSGRSPREGNSYPLQNSRLENPMNRAARVGNNCVYKTFSFAHSTSENTKETLPSHFEECISPGRYKNASIFTNCHKKVKKSSLLLNQQLEK